MPELPLDRYQFSPRDGERLERARNLLQQRCMRDFGFDDFPLEPDTWGKFRMAETFTSWAWMESPYGRLDLDQARRWGYGFDPERAKAEEAELMPKGREVTEREEPVLNGVGAGESGPSVVHGRKVPKGGCSAEAKRRFGAGVGGAEDPSSYVVLRTAEIDKVVARDERVRKAFGDWSRCVEDKGFKGYGSPARAAGDKAWREGRKDGNTRRTQRELGTAVADVECNRKLNVAGVWWAVSNEKQREDLRRHKSRYEAVRKGQDRLRAEVREVLGAA
ncbi:hypothetical protein ACFYO9_02550 [Streptomyces sp. NPDC005863]|uniref:hypothetical protein n=1 Tax=unclassified Streptomyces TaxID=2593676 RepID=UPI00340742D1